MASHFDELDKRKLDEVYKTVRLLSEQVARIQEQVGNKYLRRVIREQRHKIAFQKGYIRELESRLRL